MKAKAKSDRTAARQAAISAPHSFTDSALPDTLHNLAAHHDSTQESDAQAQGTDEAMPPVPGVEPVSDRTELLRSKPEVVGRFMRLMVPILIDVYAASVITPIRVKTLTGLLKAVGFLEGNELKTALRVGIPIFFRRSLLIISSVRTGCQLRVVHPIIERSPVAHHWSPTAC